MQQADQQQTQVYTGHSNDNQMEQTGQWKGLLTDLLNELKYLVRMHL